MMVGDGEINDKKGGKIDNGEGEKYALHYYSNKEVHLLKFGELGITLNRYHCVGYSSPCLSNFWWGKTSKGGVSIVGKWSWIITQSLIQSIVDSDVGYCLKQSTADYQL